LWRYEYNVDSQSICQSAPPRSNNKRGETGRRNSSAESRLNEHFRRVGNF